MPRPPPETTTAAVTAPAGLVPTLSLFHATMIVMGGIVGAGIFINPHVVAQQVHTPSLILGVWFLGGLIALAGAFIYAELAARLPCSGGQYAYLREAFHPAVAFSYGWALLLVIQTGGMAAVAVIFARYFRELFPIGISEGALATAALVLLTFINCLGVRAGSTVQSLLMVAKIVIISALVLCGWLLVSNPPSAPQPFLDRPVTSDLFSSIGAAMVAVIFAYGGWQTSNFIADEIREPVRNLPRALLLGVVGVITLYLAVNWVCLRVLGADGLRENAAPASAVMRTALGEHGASFIAGGIAISALGFLSQSILTAPRVYFAMARDGVFFKTLSWVHPRTHVPVAAIALQGICATIIAVTGTYEQILNYVISMDSLFFGLSASCLFVFRKRERAEGKTGPAFRVPGHPFVTIFFVATCWLIFVSVIYKFPTNSLVGVSIALTGIPVYFLWRGARRQKHD